MSFVDDPSNVLFEDKIPGASIGTRDPRTVPRAVDFNAIKGATLDLRAEALSHRTQLATAARFQELLQSIAFSSPPDPALFPFYIDISGSLSARTVTALAGAIVRATRELSAAGAGAYVVLPGSPDLSMAAGAIVKAARSGDAAATALVSASFNLTTQGSAVVVLPAPSVVAQGGGVVQTSLAASASGSAYVEGGGSFVFADDFTGADGAAPNASKWTRVYSATAPIESAADIQSNQLRFGCSANWYDEEYQEWSGAAYHSLYSSAITGVEHTIAAQVSPIAGLTLDVNVLGESYAPNAQGEATKNAIVLKFTGTASVAVLRVNDAGATAQIAAPTAIPGTNPRDVQIVTTGTDVTITVDGTQVFSGAHGVTLGSQIKLAFVATNSTGPLTTVPIDNVTVI